MKLIQIILFAVLALPGGHVSAGESFLQPLQKRDSILVADQLEYGFVLDAVPDGSDLLLPDFKEISSDTLYLVREWQLDTLNRKGGKKNPVRKIRASVVLSPFEPGEYSLPDIPVGLVTDGLVDTLLFSAQKMSVKTVRIDTATFKMHELKDLITYPVTVEEVLPWTGGALLLAALVLLAVYLVRRFSGKKAVELHKDPPHIVALRSLDRYRDSKYWAPENQKAFYSGVTDTLKEYIDARFGIDAPEMTTAELFSALKGSSELAPELYLEMKTMFEEADFVKFAKHTVSDEDNAKVLPTAVRFVTSTYQSEVEQEQEKGGEA